MNSPSSVNGFGSLSSYTERLTPVSSSEMTDEQDMGLSYEELSIFGRLRRIERLGPFGMFQKCLVLFHDMTPRQVFEKVRRFNHYYGINRHKTETLTIGYVPAPEPMFPCLHPTAPRSVWEILRKPSNTDGLCKATTRRRIRRTQTDMTFVRSFIRPSRGLTTNAGAWWSDSRRPLERKSHDIAGL